MGNGCSSFFSSTSLFFAFAVFLAAAEMSKREHSESHKDPFTFKYFTTPFFFYLSVDKNVSITSKETVALWVSSKMNAEVYFNHSKRVRDEFLETVPLCFRLVLTTGTVVTDDPVCACMCVCLVNLFGQSESQS